MAKLSAEKIENFKKGKINLSQVFEVDAKQTAALLTVGHVLYEQGRYPESRAIIEGCVVLDPGNPYLHALLGSVYQKEGHLAAAIDRYSTAVTIFPGDIHSYVNRGEIFLKQGKFQEAADDLKKAADLDPDGKNPAANRARMLIALTQQVLQIAKQNGADAVLEMKKQLDSNQA
jgi:Putative Zn-dependent protease, contains TPR repeats